MMIAPGATLSRWTMSYFAAALVFLLSAETMLAAGFWTPSMDIGDPAALIIVHLTAIGWLGLLMIGALLQFGPVLTGSDLPIERLSLPCLVAMIAGLLCLATGFAATLQGSVLAGPLMISAAFMLGGGILAITGVMLAGLWRARHVHAASSFVIMAIVSLAITVSLGAIFGLTISGVTDSHIMVGLVLQAVPLHASFGLIGWLTFAAIGASYKLLPMFLLSPDSKGTRAVLNTGALALAVLGAALAFAIWNPELARPIASGASVIMLGTFAAYLRDVRSLYNARRRKILELNTLGSVPAFAFLALSTFAFVTSMALDVDQRFLTALVYLFVFGWLTALGLAQLLKIVPFLTWIEAFGPLLGRCPTPRLNELVKGRRALISLAVFYAAVALASCAIAAGVDLLFRFAATLQCVSTAALVLELFQARALAHVPPAVKSEHIRQPALFVAKMNLER